MATYDQLSKDLTRHFILQWKVTCSQLSSLLRAAPALLEADFFRQRLRLSQGSLPASPGLGNTPIKGRGHHHSAHHHPASGASAEAAHTKHVYPLDRIVGLVRVDALTLNLRVVGQANAFVAQGYQLGFASAEQSDEFMRLVRANLLVDGPRVVERFLASQPSPEGYIRLEDLAEPRWRRLLTQALDPSDDGVNTAVAPGESRWPQLSFFGLFGSLLSLKEQQERTAPPQKLFGAALWDNETVLLCCPLAWRVHPTRATLSRGVLLLTSVRLLYLTYAHTTQTLVSEDYDEWAAAPQQPHAQENAQEHAVEQASSQNHAENHSMANNVHNAHNDLVRQLVRQTHPDAAAQDPDCVSVSYLLVEQVQVTKAQQLRLDLADQRCVLLGVDRISLTMLAKHIGRMVGQYRTDFRRLFAFQSFNHQLEAAGLVPGWRLYDPRAEYARLGLAGGDWRLIRTPAQHSYPEWVAVPAAVSEEKLRAAASCRRHARFPVTVFRFGPTNASLSRSAAPVAPSPAAMASHGGHGFHTETDEELLGILRVLNPNWPPRPLYIAATGNVCERDVGVVSPPTTFRYFLQKSPGIQQAQQSLAQFQQLVANCADSQDWVREPAVVTDAGSFEAIFAANDPEALASTETRAIAVQLKNDSQWYERLAQSRWLSGIRLLMYHARLVVEIMTTRAASVLLHDPDGWDRSSQLSALAQVMMDPHFRTLRGFCELVEKEWLTMGHPFALRNGFGHALDAAAAGGGMGGGADYSQGGGGVPPGAGGSDQLAAHKAPVFLQWVECVWQLAQQFPFHFEFSSAFLVYLLEELHTGRFGTFLLNGERQRSAAQVHSRTASFWTPVLTAVQVDPRHRFLNPAYDAQINFAGNSPVLGLHQGGANGHSVDIPVSGLGMGGDGTSGAAHSGGVDGDKDAIGGGSGDDWPSDEDGLSPVARGNDQPEDEADSQPQSQPAPSKPPSLSPEQFNLLIQNWWTNRLRLFYDRYDADRVASAPQELQQWLDEQDDAILPPAQLLNERFPGYFEGLMQRYRVSPAQVEALWEIGGALEPPVLPGSPPPNSPTYAMLQRKQRFLPSLRRQHIRLASGPESGDSPADRGHAVGDSNADGDGLDASHDTDQLGRSPQGDQLFPGVLKPDVRQHAIQFWSDYYLRWESPEAGPVAGGEGGRPLRFHLDLRGWLQRNGHRLAVSGGSETSSAVSQAQLEAQVKAQTEAEAKAEATKEELQRTQEQLGALEIELRTLQNQLETTGERNRELAERLAQLQTQAAADADALAAADQFAQAAARSKMELESAVAAGTAEATQLKTRLQEVETELAQLRAELSKGQDLVRDRESQLEKSRAELAALQAQLQAKTGEAGELEKTLAAATERRDVLQGELDSLRKELEEARTAAAQAAREAEARASQLEASLPAEAVAGIRTELEAKVGALGVERAQLEEKLVAKEAELEQLRADHDAELRRMRETAETAESEIARIQGETQAAGHRAAEHELAAQTARTRVEDLENQLSAADTHRQELEAARDRAEARVAELETQLAAVEAEHTRRVAELESQASAKAGEHERVLGELRAEATAAQERLQAEVTQLQSQVSALSQDASAGAEQLQQDLQAKQARLGELEAQLQAQTEAAERQDAARTEEISRLSLELRAGQELVEELMAAREQLQQQLETQSKEFLEQKEQFEAERERLEAQRLQDIQEHQAKLDAQEKQHAQEMEEIEAQRLALQPELEAQKQRAETHQQELEARKQELETHKQDLEAKQQELQAKQRELEAKQQELEAERQQTNTLKTQIQAHADQVEAQTAQLAQTRSSEAALQAELDAVRDQLKTVQGQLDLSSQQGDEQVVELRRQASEAQARLGEAERRVVALESETGVLREQLEAREARLRAEQDAAREHSLQLGELRAQHSVVQASLEEQRTQREQTQAELAGLREKLGAAEQAQVEAQQQLQETRKQVEQAEQRVKEAEQRVEQAQEKMREAQQQAQDAQKQAEDAKQQAEEALRQAETAQKQAQAHEQQAQETQKQIQEAQRQAEDFQKQAQEAQQRAEQAEQRAEQAELQVVSQASEALAKAGDAEGLQEVITELRGSLETSETHRLRLQEQAEALRQAEHQLEAQLAQVRDQASETQARLDTAQAAAEQAQALVAEKTVKLESQAAEIQELRLALARLEEQDRVLGERATQAEAQREALETRMAASEARREEAERQLVEARTRAEVGNEAQTALVKQLQAQLEEARASTQRAELGSEELRKRLAQLEAEKAELRAELERQRQQHDADDRRRQQAHEVRLAEAEKLPADQPKWTVQIRNWVQAEDKSYIAFNLVVREYFTRRRYLSWTVARRYSEFAAMHQQCAKLFKHVVLPPMPPKGGLRNKTREFQNQRMKALEIMLQAMLKETDLLGMEGVAAASAAAAEASRARAGSVVGLPQDGGSPLLTFMGVGQPGREIQEGEDA